MPWKTHDPLPGRPVIGLDFAGDVTEDELTAAFGATLSLAQKYDTWLVLTDLRAMTGGHTVVDLFGLVETLRGLGVRQRYRQALVPPGEPSLAESVHFWETAGRNRGLAMRVFDSVPAAEAWLLDDGQLVTADDEGRRRL